MEFILASDGVQSIIQKSDKLAGCKGTVNFEFIKDSLFLTCQHKGILLCGKVLNTTQDIPNGTIFEVPVRRLKKLTSGRKKAAIMFDFDLSVGNTLGIRVGNELSDSDLTYSKFVSILDGKISINDIIGKLKLCERHTINNVKATASLLHTRTDELLEFVNKGKIKLSSGVDTIASNHTTELFDAIEKLAAFGGCVGFGNNKYFAASETTDNNIAHSCVMELPQIRISNSKTLFTQQFIMTAETALSVRDMFSAGSALRYLFLSEAELLLTCNGRFIIAPIEAYADITGSLRYNFACGNCQQVAMRSVDLKELLACLERGLVSPKQKVTMMFDSGVLTLSALSEEGESVIKSKPYKHKANRPQVENFSFETTFGKLQTIAEIHSKTGNFTEFRLYTHNSIHALRLLNERGEVTADMKVDYSLPNEFIGMERIVTNKAGSVPEIILRRKESASSSDGDPCPKVVELDKYKKEKAV